MTKAKRTAPCTPDEGANRLQHAKKFLEVAEVVAGEIDVPASLNCAGSLAVLAGIAASDAACRAVLGRHSRSANHADAAELLEQIANGGAAAAKSLRRLIQIKDEAQYQMGDLSGAKLRTAIRAAAALVEFAEVRSS